MKKILFLSTISFVLLNAEMMQQGSSGVFISNEERTEIHEAMEKDISFAERAELMKIKRNKHKDNSNTLSEKDNLEELPLENKSKKKYSKYDEVFLETKKEKRDLAIGEEDNLSEPKLKLKKYNVKYTKENFYLAYYLPTKKEFKLWLKTYGINKVKFKLMINSTKRLEHILLSAAYYDFFLNDPSTAENFYKLIYKQRRSLKLGQKYFLADYLIRTGRGSKINKIIGKMECAAMFKGNSLCYYYQGVGSFLRTGNNRNRDIFISKGRNKKAKALYYMK